MAKANFDQSLQLVLAHEGGYTNNPKDPGGATMKGVTQAVYDAYRAGQGLASIDVRQITDDELTAIYRRQYWDQVHGDDLPAGLDYAVFDYAVNSGPARAVEDLQRAVSVTPVDGKLGLMTLQAVHAAATADLCGLIQAYCERRLAFLRSLKTWPTFGAGWTRRVEGDNPGVQDGDLGVIDFAVKMAKSQPIETAELPATIGAEAGEEGGRGVQADQRVITKAAAAPAISHAGAGLVGGVITAAGTAATYAPQLAQHAAAVRDIAVANQSFLPALGHIAAVATAVIVGCGFVGLGYRWWQQRHQAR